MSRHVKLPQKGLTGLRLICELRREICNNRFLGSVSKKNSYPKLVHEKLSLKWMQWRTIAFDTLEKTEHRALFKDLVEFIERHVRIIRPSVW